jgi:hypothetical protein
VIIPDGLNGLNGLNGAKARQEGDRAHCHHDRCAKSSKVPKLLASKSPLSVKSDVQGRKQFGDT